MAYRKAVKFITKVRSAKGGTSNSANAPMRLAQPEEQESEAVQEQHERNCEILRLYNELISRVQTQNLSIEHVNKSFLEKLSYMVTNETGELAETPSRLKQKLCPKELLSAQPFFDFLTKTYAHNGGTLHALLQAIKEVERMDIITALIEQLKSKSYVEPPVTQIARPTVNERVQPGITVGPGSNNRRVLHRPFLLPVNVSQELLDELNDLEEGGWNRELPQVAYPPLVTENLVTVFVTHTEEDVLLALWTKHILRKHFNCIVITQYEISLELQIDFGKLQHFLKEVNFIVPIVTPRYLTEIEESNGAEDFENARLDVKYIFSVCQNDFYGKAGRIYKIRPLIHGVSQGVVRDHSVELRSFFRLWRGIPNLAYNIIQTKTKYGKSFYSDRIPAILAS